MTAYLLYSFEVVIFFRKDTHLLGIPTFTVRRNGSLKSFFTEKCSQSPTVDICCQDYDNIKNRNVLQKTHHKRVNRPNTICCLSAFSNGILGRILVGKN